jgi:hypothetical protein
MTRGSDDRTEWKPFSPSYGTVAITDTDWYRFLLAHPEIAEVNHWKPSARRGFRAPPFAARVGWTGAQPAARVYSSGLPVAIIEALN